MLAGLLDIAVSGQSCRVLLDDGDIRVQFDSFRQARGFDAKVHSFSPVFGRAMRLHGLRLLVQIGGWRAVELFPRSPWYARWLSRRFNDLS